MYKSKSYSDYISSEILSSSSSPRFTRTLRNQKVMDPPNNIRSKQTLDETAQGGYTCHRCCIWNSFVHKFCRECEHRICGVCILGPWGLGEGEDRVRWPRPQITDRSLWPFLPFERERRPGDGLGWRGVRRLRRFAEKKSRR